MWWTSTDERLRKGAQVSGKGIIFPFLTLTREIYDRYYQLYILKINLLIYLLMYLDVIFSGNIGTYRIPAKKIKIFEHLTN